MPPQSLPHPISGPLRISRRSHFRPQLAPLLRKLGWGGAGGVNGAGIGASQQKQPRKIQVPAVASKVQGGLAVGVEGAHLQE